MKTNAIIRIVLFSLAILILTSLLLGVTAYDKLSFSNRVESDGEHHVMYGSMYSADPNVIRNIKIEWAAGSITIVRGTGSHITVSESEVTNERYTMRLNESGSTLNIKYCEDAVSFIGFGNHDFEAKDLVITVPTSWSCDNLEIEAAAARVDVTDLTIREVDFDGASAICSFENCQIDSLDVDTASGDVNFSGILEELDFDAMSACFDAVFHNVPNHMDMDSMSGDLDITLPEGSGFSLQMDAMSSDFSSDFATTTQNGRYLHGDGHCRINVSAMSGDVCIRKAAKQ